MENRCYVIEVNGNPSVDAGNEDTLLKDAFYREVMNVFLKRVEARKRANSRWRQSRPFIVDQERSRARS